MCNCSHSLMRCIIAACSLLFGMEGSSMTFGKMRCTKLANVLPYDMEVEYLESTGTQWIDTGATVSNTSHIVIRMSNYSQAGAWMFGARRGYLQSAVGIYAEANTAINSFRFAWGGYLTRTPFTYTTTNVGIVTIDISAGLLTITRERIPYIYTEQATAQTFTTPVPMWLFTLNNNGTVTNVSIMRIHGVQIDNLRDFIPVRFTNENGVSEGAMYDKMSKQLFRNQGTGAFITGPDKT